MDGSAEPYPMPARLRIAATFALALAACASARPGAPSASAAPRPTSAPAAAASERAGPPPDEGSPAVVSLPTSPLEARWADRRWAVAVDLPGFAAAAPQASGQAEVVHVLATDQGGMVVSVSMRQSPGATAAGCRDRDWARIQAGVEGLRDARVFQRAGVPRATYLVPTLDGKPVEQLNAHAWLAREGICIHVHASKMQPDPGDATAMERILGSIRFSEIL